MPKRKEALAVAPAVAPGSAAYARPVRLVDHRTTFARLADWSGAAYRGYRQELSELAEPKHRSYANPAHSVRGFDGDARLHALRRDLLGFQDRPIELQMKMHEAAFEIEAPLIYLDECVSLCSLKSRSV